MTLHYAKVKQGFALARGLSYAPGPGDDGEGDAALAAGLEGPDPAAVPLQVAEACGDQETTMAPGWANPGRRSNRIQKPQIG